MPCVWHIVEKVVKYSHHLASILQYQHLPTDQETAAAAAKPENQPHPSPTLGPGPSQERTASYGGGQLQHKERVLADGVAAHGHVAAFRFTIYGGNPNLHERESPLVQKRKQSHSIHHVSLGDAVLFEKSVVVENGGKRGG
jgi:hypothetical protein